MDDLHDGRFSTEEIISPTLELLYSSGPTIVVNKPSGLSTQAPRGIECLELLVRRRFGALLEASPEAKEFVHRRPDGAPYVGVPHRIDRPVSGAILFTSTKRAARKLSKQFQRRQIEKVYWACTRGAPTPADGVWRDMVRKLPGEARATSAAPDEEGAEEAVLHYRTLGETPHGAWLEIRLETGRFHQIRIQAALRGHALLGDVDYGCEIPFGPPVDDPRRRAIALHARRLGFVDPTTKQTVRIEAPPPEVWGEVGLPPADWSG